MPSGVFTQEQKDAASQRLRDMHAKKRLDKENTVKESIITQEPLKTNNMSTAVLDAPVKTKSKELFSSRGNISIRPYVSGEPKFGLEIHGEALFPGTWQDDHIGLEEKNGVLTYFTGLNEFAHEVQSIHNQEEKEAKVKQIRTTVAYLENTANANFSVTKENCMVGYGTPQDSFWSNVTMFKSSGPSVYGPSKHGHGKERIPTYWDGITLTLDNKGRELDLTDPVDLVIYHAIEASGMGMVAPSLEVAIDTNKYNFYLHKPEQASAIRVGPKKDKAKALGALEAMSNADPIKLFYITKMASTQASQYHRGGLAETPLNQMYEDTYNYIDGKTGESSSRAVERFLSLYNKSMDELKIRVIVKDATELRFLAPRGDGQIYYIKDSVALGKNVEDVVASLNNPLNQGRGGVWDSLVKDVENEWRKY